MASLLALTLFSLVWRSHAVMPTFELEFRSESHSSTLIYASEAYFGPVGKTRSLVPVYPPSTDAGLCDTTPDLSFVPPSSSRPFAFIVPRGNCTFQGKTLQAARYGASAIVIYNTLQTMYWHNTTHLTFPTDKADYECANGEGFISPIQLTIPYYSPANDELFSSNACSTNSKCASRKCVVTGKSMVPPDVDEGEQLMQVCCAWDMYQYLYADYSLPNPTIPAVFVTIRGEEDFAPFLLVEGDEESSSSTVTISPRWRPTYNASSFLIWLLGCFVAWLGASIASSDLSDAIKHRLYDLSSSGGDAGTGGGGGTGAANRPPPPPPPSRAQSEQIGAGETVTLTAIHAVLFLVFSSIVLITLFFFNLYKAVTVFYAFGCSGAVTQVLLLPLFRKLRDSTSSRPFFDATLVTVPFGVGPCTRLDVLSSATGYAFGGVWLSYALSNNAPDYAPYWVLQDVFGLCMCVLFLSVVRLPSLKVASLLLTAAFLYDIFFVFLSPLIFSSSVMITVATGGKGPTTDPLTCEKYPSTAGCQQPNPLPMLFSVPRINDYMGGGSLLGLGDIVLPGLLLAFAGRFDRATYFVALHPSNGGGGGGGGGGDGDDANGSSSGATSNPMTEIMDIIPDSNNSSARSRPPFNPLSINPKALELVGWKGYFPMVVVGYGVGLMMANMAVYIMQQGQPALLYLVPCTLGPVLVKGYYRGELGELFRGPKVVKEAEAILDGRQGSGDDTDGGDTGGENHNNIEEGAAAEGERGSLLTNRNKNWCNEREAV